MKKNWKKHPKNNQMRYLMSFMQRSVTRQGMSWVCCDRIIVFWTWSIVGTPVIGLFFQFFLNDFSIHIFTSTTMFSYQQTTVRQSNGSKTYLNTF